MAVFQYFVFSRGDQWWAEVGHFYFTVRMDPQNMESISAAQITEKQGVDFISQLMPQVRRSDIVLVRDMGHFHIASLGATKAQTEKNLKVLDALVLESSRYLMQ
jgi:hypothetical protein